MAYLDIFDRAEISAAPVNNAKARKVSAALVANHTAVVPTVIVWPGYTLNRDTLINLPALAYLPEAKKQEWYKFREAASLGKYSSIQNKLEQIDFLNKQRVLILAGSDCENPFTVTGFSLHDELELLVKAGLSPLQALQTATLNPAIFLNKEKDLGTVAKGKLADLVILEQNPLTDIRDTRSIHAVIMNGNLLDKKQIARFLEQVKERASK
jgi:imidazolonepropionase-like amidohydrolase